MAPRVAQGGTHEAILTAPEADRPCTVGEMDVGEYGARARQPGQYGFVTIRASRPATKTLTRQLERYSDRGAKQGNVGWQVHIDEAPVCMFQFQTPVTFPVAAGEHVLHVRYVSDRRSDRVALRALQVDGLLVNSSAFQLSIAAGERVELSWGKQRRVTRSLEFARLGSSCDANISTAAHGTRPWPAPSSEQVDGSLEDLSVSALQHTPLGPESEQTDVDGRPSSRSALPGSVTHTGRCRYELRQVFPIPYVAPGVQHVWRASEETIEARSNTEGGIRVQGGVSLGWVSLSLSKHLGAEPSLEQTQHQRQELELTLDGDLSTSWEVHTFDVWQVVDVETDTGERVQVEYLSMPTASAFPR